MPAFPLIDRHLLQRADPSACGRKGRTRTETLITERSLSLLHEGGFTRNARALLIWARAQTPIKPTYDYPERLVHRIRSRCNGPLPLGLAAKAEEEARQARRDFDRRDRLRSDGTDSLSTGEPVKDRVERMTRDAVRAAFLSARFREKRSMHWEDATVTVNFVNEDNAGLAHLLVGERTVSFARKRAIKGLTADITVSRYWLRRVRALGLSTLCYRALVLDAIKVSDGLALALIAQQSRGVGVSTRIVRLHKRRDGSGWRVGERLDSTSWQALLTYHRNLTTTL